MRRNLVGPVVLITAGVLFLLDEFTQYDWGRTWPILLIAIGAAIALQRMQPSAPEAYPPAQPPAAGPDTSSDKVNHV